MKSEPLRVVLIGPESTGKTCLASELATRYDVASSPEYARAYVEALKNSLSYSDVDAIAKGQKQAEDEAIERAVGLGERLVILDTDLVSTMVYSHHYYGDCPAWIERAAGARLGDLYLLHHTDVDWVADGDQREQPERREELFERFRGTLSDLGAPVSNVHGVWEIRRNEAIDAIDRIMM